MSNNENGHSRHSAPREEGGSGKSAAIGAGALLLLPFADAAINDALADPTLGSPDDVASSATTGLYCPTADSSGDVVVSDDSAQLNAVEEGAPEPFPLSGWFYSPRFDGTNIQALDLSTDDIYLISPNGSGEFTNAEDPPTASSHFDTSTLDYSDSIGTDFSGGFAVDATGALFAYTCDNGSNFVICDSYGSELITNASRGNDANRGNPSYAMIGNSELLLFDESGNTYGQFLDSNGSRLGSAIEILQNSDCASIHNGDIYYGENGVIKKRTISFSDDDNDGVPDQIDSCLNTPEDEVVGDDGCGASNEDADEDGYSAADDCNDTDADINPGADEICDGIDNDCNDLIDDEDPGITDQNTFHEDKDEDGFGNANAARSSGNEEIIDSCDEEPPEGYVSDATDCNDNDVDTNPIADELCDGRDNDCDDAVDEDAIDAPTWYLDADGDGFGDPNNALVDCEAPTNYVSDNTDCDDNDQSNTSDACVEEVQCDDDGILRPGETLCEGGNVTVESGSDLEVTEDGRIILNGPVHVTWTGGGSTIDGKAYNGITFDTYGEGGAYILGNLEGTGHNSDSGVSPRPETPTADAKGEGNGEYSDTNDPNLTGKLSLDEGSSAAVQGVHFEGSTDTRELDVVLTGPNTYELADVVDAVEKQTPVSTEGCSGCAVGDKTSGVPLAGLSLLIGAAALARRREN
jgi:MYXO-CTERM domain-containing protein